MNSENWLKQQDEPAFGDLVWSKPENKQAAGKLLIVGGHKHELHAPIKAYDFAEKAGVGESWVAMPDSVPQAILMQEHVRKLPASKSGGISTEAFNSLSQLSSAADVVLWPGAMGRDSQTVQLLEKLLSVDKTKTVLSDDSADTLIKIDSLTNRPETCFVLTLSQLSALNIRLKSTIAVTHNMQLTNLIEILQKMTDDRPIAIATLYDDKLLTAFAGMVSTTQVNEAIDNEDFRWRLDLSCHIAVLWAQFPTQTFEAMTTAAWIFKEDHDGQSADQ